jgi:ectoine hydroxylase-related dioxygenase (phytanoyl-CoA dioxygenase family)
VRRRYREGRLPTTRRSEDGRAQPVLMEPGSVLLLGPYTVHGSKPSRSKHARRVFINGYAYPGANRRVYPGKGAGRKVVAGP